MDHQSKSQAHYECDANIIGVQGMSGTILSNVTLIHTCRALGCLRLYFQTAEDWSPEDGYSHVHQTSANSNINGHEAWEIQQQQQQAMQQQAPKRSPAQKFETTFEWRWVHWDHASWHIGQNSLVNPLSTSVQGLLLASCSDWL